MIANIVKKMRLILCVTLALVLTSYCFAESESLSVDTLIDVSVINSQNKANSSFLKISDDNNFKGKSKHIYFQIRFPVEGASISALEDYEGYYYAGTDRGMFKLELTEDSQAQEWRSAGLQDKSIVLLSHIAGSLYVATNAGEIYTTRGNNDNWENIFPKKEPKKSIISALSKKANKNITSLFASGDYIYIGTNDGVFKAKIGTNDWQKAGLDGEEIDFLYGCPTQMIVSDVIKQEQKKLSGKCIGDCYGSLYAVTSNGKIYRSDNDGNNWTNVGQNNIDTPLALTSSDGCLYVVTEKNDILVTKNSGKKWKSFKKISENTFPESVFVKECYMNLITDHGAFKDKMPGCYESEVDKYIALNYKGKSVASEMQNYGTIPYKPILTFSSSGDYGHDFSCLGDGEFLVVFENKDLTTREQAVRFKIFREDDEVLTFDTVAHHLFAEQGDNRYRVQAKFEKYDPDFKYTNYTLTTIDDYSNEGKDILEGTYPPFDVSIDIVNKKVALKPYYNGLEELEIKNPDSNFGKLSALTDLEDGKGLVLDIGECSANDYPVGIIYIYVSYLDAPDKARRLTFSLPILCPNTKIPGIGGVSKGAYYVVDSLTSMGYIPKIISTAVLTPALTGCVYKGFPYILKFLAHKLRILKIQEDVNLIDLRPNIFGAAPFPAED